MSDGDMEAAMRAVVEDMGAAVRKSKGRRYAPKEKAPEAKPEAPAEDTSDMPSAGELEAMLTGE